MSRKKSGSVSVPYDTKADPKRRKAVEKVLKDLSNLGLEAPARFGLNNTMIGVPAKDGFVRVDLGLTEPEDVLRRMFDAVWNAGIEAGARNEREKQAAAIMMAFPALKETFEKIADERIDLDRARNGYGDN